MLAGLWRWGECGCGGDWVVKGCGVMAVAGIQLMAVWRRAGWSLRLRLHSGLRQSGGACGPGGFFGLAEARPFRWLVWGGIGGVC